MRGLVFLMTVTTLDTRTNAPFALKDRPTTT
jgi:hypothetical protein